MHVSFGEFEVEGDLEAFDAWFSERAVAMRTCKGCLKYEFLTDPLHPNRRCVFEAWATSADHAAHLNHPDHIEMLARGSRDFGECNIWVNHWDRAEGHISRGRDRSDGQFESVQPDHASAGEWQGSERAEMYRRIREYQEANPA
jgi:quinol monooxygenase YgiN